MDPSADAPLTWLNQSVVERLIRTSEASTTPLRKLHEHTQKDAAIIQAIIQQGAVTRGYIESLRQNSAFRRVWSALRPGVPLPVEPISTGEEPAPVRQEPVLQPSKGTPGRRKKWTTESLREFIVKKMVERLMQDKPITQPWIAAAALDRDESTLQYHLRETGLSYTLLKREAKDEARKRGWIAP